MTAAAMRLPAIVLAGLMLVLAATARGAMLDQVAIAACAGALAAGQRRVAAPAAALLALLSFWHHAPGWSAGTIAGLLLMATAAIRPLRLDGGRWIAALPAIAAAQLAGLWLVPAGVPWSIVTAGAAVVAMVGGFALGQRLRDPADPVDAVRYSLADADRLSETARCLLLGRIAGGLSHELAQSLNVIVMANGNLGYVLNRADMPEPYAAQLLERVRKIATHADTASQMLGHFRWFGRDGSREGDMTVGTALERAVGATRAAARRCGVAIDIRGDALTHPVPLRHGTIEMMATAALLDMCQQLAARPASSEPAQPIILEATRTQASIEIAVLTRSSGLAGPVHDDVAEAIYDLVARVAASCRSEIRRVARDGDPTRYLLTLNRDMV